jgi:competence protein ComEC
MPIAPNLSEQPRAGTTAIPLFHAAWLFAAGIALAGHLWLQPSVVLVALALVAVACAVAVVHALHIAWLPLAALWMLLGAWCGEMEPHPAPAPALAALSDGLLRNVEGTVVDTGPVRAELEQNVDEPNSSSPSQRVDLRVESVEVVNDESDALAPVSGGVRLTVRSTGEMQPFRCGERIRAVVRLLPPEIYHDPGVWSREDFLLDQGITSSATVATDRVERLGRAPGAFMSCRVRAWQHASAERLLALPAAMRNFPAPLRLSEDDAAMLSAMVAGDRTWLTHALRSGFERTGSFHMLVVSGLHLAIVAACLFWIFKRLRLPRVPATLLTIAASFAYALFTGFATPVQRSLWMVTLYLVGRLIYRERSPLNTIGFAALCLLVVSPRSLFDSSLQMTLLAVVAVAGVAAPLLAGTIHPYVTATRDLKLVAIDIKLPRQRAQFRVLMRMVAERLQTAFGPPVAVSRAPHETAIEDKMPPERALIQDSLRVSGEALREAVRGRGAWAIAWRVFPWAVRFGIRVFELFVVTCVVELAMTLPMAVYFHRITLFALPVNLLIVPLLVVLIPAALVTLLLLIVWPAVAVVPAMMVALAMHIGIGLVHLFGSMAMGDFRIPGPLLWQSAAFIALLGAAIALAHEGLKCANFASGRPTEAATYGLWSSSFYGLFSMRTVTLGPPEAPVQIPDPDHARSRGRWLRRSAWIALAFAAVVAVLPRPIDRPRGAMLMEAIDVGQGDSLLVITPKGKTLLIDGGGFGGGPQQAPQDFDIGEEVVSPALWARGIRHLDAVALSHAHSDHMGGLPAILRNFHPDELWVGNNPQVASYNALLDEAAALHVRVRSFRAGDQFAFGETKVAVLAPFRDYQPGAEPANNDSLVLHVAFGATSVLLEGDAEAPVEEAMLAEPGLESTLLKVGHHGSITSTRPEFLARVAPQWAVISCGLHNRYGHPREEVLEDLQTAQVRTLRTDLNGVSCFTLDGHSAVPDFGCK